MEYPSFLIENTSSIRVHFPASYVRLPECNPLYTLNNHLEPETSTLKWLFQLDDSKSLHRKWLFHQTSIKKWLFGVPGRSFFIAQLTNQELDDIFSQLRI